MHVEQELRRLYTHHVITAGLFVTAAVGSVMPEFQLVMAWCSMLVNTYWVWSD